MVNGYGNHPVKPEARALPRPPPAAAADGGCFTGH